MRCESTAELRLFLIILLISGALSGVVTNDLDRPNRIVGGDEVKEGEFPWQVSLQRILGPLLRTHFCGATLINKSWVVTAAHCAQDEDFVKRNVAVLGGWNLRRDGEEYKISKVVFNGYDPSTMTNDIALLKLDLSSGRKRTNTGHEIGIQDINELENETCIISGWGKLEARGSIPNIMHAAKVNLVSDTVCRTKLSQVTSKIQDTQLCAGGNDIDACQGDSGGPLVCCGSSVIPTVENCRLTGITSWGIGCATPGFPGVYTEVSHFRNWIQTTIETN